MQCSLVGSAHALWSSVMHVEKKNMKFVYSGDVFTGIIMLSDDLNSLSNNSYVAQHGVTRTHFFLSFYFH